MNADRGIAEGFEAAARMLSPSSWAKCCRHRPTSVTVWTPMLLLITASPEVTTLVILTRDRAVRLGDCFRACPCYCVSRPKDDVKQLMDPIRSRAPLSSPRVYSMPNFPPPGCPDTFGVCQVHKHSSGADDSTKEAADVLRFDASTEVFHSEMGYTFAMQMARSISPESVGGARWCQQKGGHELRKKDVQSQQENVLLPYVSRIASLTVAFLVSEDRIRNCRVQCRRRHHPEQPEQSEFVAEASNAVQLYAHLSGAPELDDRFTTWACMDLSRTLIPPVSWGQRVRRAPPKKVRLNEVVGSLF